MIETVKNIYRYLRILIIRLFSFFFSKRIEIPNSILIIAPHPDDETFGCAGLIQRALSEGKKVKVLILTGGEGAYTEDLIAKVDLIEKRKALTLKAAAHLGLDAKEITFWDWKDGEIKDTYNKERLEQLIIADKPEAIFTPHLFEGWSDHTATTEVVMRVLEELSANIKLFQYCVWIWYSMPYSKLPAMGWKNAYSLLMNSKKHTNKRNAIDEYLNPLTTFGEPYSGILPHLFIKANQWNHELFFKIDKNEKT